MFIGAKRNEARPMLEGPLEFGHFACQITTQRINRGVLSIVCEISDASGPRRRCERIKRFVVPPSGGIRYMHERKTRLKAELRNAGELLNSFTPSYEGVKKSREPHRRM